jgi:hypothetical protein
MIALHTCSHLINIYQIRRLYIADTKALNHVLMNSYDYQKAPIARYNLSRVVGPGEHTVASLSLPIHVSSSLSGVLVVEEDEHKHQVLCSLKLICLV